MNSTLSLLKSIAAAALLTLTLVACGGGGCDAGEPLYANQQRQYHEQCDTPPPTTPASGGQR